MAQEIITENDQLALTETDSQRVLDLLGDLPTPRTKLIYAHAK